MAVTSTNNLKLGSKGSDVTELQKLLNQNGYNLAEDGSFGPKTLEAVKDYQQKNGLTVDGIVGTNTWGTLTKATSTTPTTTEEVKAPTFEYKPSDAVTQAEELLKQHITNKPGEYQSAWQTQLNDLLQKILNREKFSYDLNGDMLYQQYKDQYTTQGKLASMDVMGQAAAMTGGYGNSYAQTAGQQAYQGYLQQLNDRVPELYQLALNQYNAEGDEMYNQASLMAQMEEQDYGRHRDTVSDYYTELANLKDDARYMSETEYERAWNDFNAKYGAYRDTVADDQWQAEFDFAKQQYEDSKKKTTSSTKKKKDPVDPVDPPVDPGFTGTTYSEAVAYAKSHGVAGSYASSILDQATFSRKKSSSSPSEAKEFDTYQEYLQYAVETMIEAYGK